jgi:hypothetical protein
VDAGGKMPMSDLTEFDSKHLDEALSIVSNDHSAQHNRKSHFWSWSCHSGYDTNTKTTDTKTKLKEAACSQKQIKQASAARKKAGQAKKCK